MFYLPDSTDELAEELASIAGAIRDEAARLVDAARNLENRAESLMAHCASLTDIERNNLATAMTHAGTICLHDIRHAAQAVQGFGESLGNFAP